MADSSGGAFARTGQNEEVEHPHGCLSPRDLAKFLRVSDATVAVLLKTGDIPSFRVGGSRRILREDLDAYIGRRTSQQ